MSIDHTPAIRAFVEERLKHYKAENGAPVMRYSVQAELEMILALCDGLQKQNDMLATTPDTPTEFATASDMKDTEPELTKEHISIMEHTRDRAAGGYYCGDSPEMQELVVAGLMESAGRKSFVLDEYFQLTRKGREALLGLANLRAL